jgi:hypothetical protein
MTELGSLHISHGITVKVNEPKKEILSLRLKTSSFYGIYVFFNSVIVMYGGRKRVEKFMPLFCYP